jgi:hypothetical protein
MGFLENLFGSIFNGNDEDSTETCVTCGEELVDFGNNIWGCPECEDDDDDGVPKCASGCGGYPEHCMGCNLGGNR